MVVSSWKSALFVRIEPPKQKEHHKKPDYNLLLSIRTHSNEYSLSLALEVGERQIVSRAAEH